MPPRDFTHDLRRLTRDGADLDEGLRKLRANGVSIVECIVAVRGVRGCELVEAKRLVDTSPAWADIAAQNEKLHEELEAAAREVEK